jgi:hypothetical protein
MLTIQYLAMLGFGFPAFAELICVAIETAFADGRTIDTFRGCGLFSVLSPPKETALVLALPFYRA